MSKPEKPGAGISISVGGSNLGALWVGDHNRVIVNAKTGATTVLTREDVRGLADAVTTLRERVASEAPSAQREAALAQVDHLQAAILPAPEVNKMKEVRDWVVKHLPSLLGAFATFFVNPILGQVVEASGEMAASAFRSHFGVS
ncbi:MAG: hypothetical protein WCC84_14735 [Candidatus Cybelea sp.]